MADLHITDIEAAINHWRDKHNNSDGVSLSAPIRALAQVYGRMVFERRDGIDEWALSAETAAAFYDWYATTPDTPCIAICSTSQGDAMCKGCGRSFEEVQLWTEFTVGEKRQVWNRITSEGTAWRFNRYAERAQHDRHAVKAAATAQQTIPGTGLP
jgi:uncharacterized protein